MELHLKYARPNAEKDDRPIYYIGPFGSRVSFQSQQRRALNIVGSLIEMNQIEDDDEVAIIGAGLAGMTAFAALSLQGYSVKLYEKGSGILTLQALSRHRYIHPTVNFWPHANPERTTNLPFFDWYSSDCPNVIEALLRQWDEDPNEPSRKDPMDPKYIQQFTVSDPYFNHHMIFSDYDAETRKVCLVEKNSGVRAEVNLVLVTVGFGVEDNLGDLGQNPYWRDDALVDMSRQSGHDVIISGAGDGGLIDCLRFTFEGFKKGDFALDVIEALGKGSYASRENLKSIEEAAGKISNEDERAKFLERSYKSILPKLNRSTKEMLSRALVKRSSGKYANRIRLIGQYSAPFEIGAAPINRLLVAYALQENAIEFINAKLDRDGDGYFLCIDGRKEYLEKGAKVIVRHGPRKALEGFLDDEEAKKLRFAQQAPGDFASEGSFQNHYFIPERSEYPSLDRDPARFAEFRHGLAYKFILERYGALTKLGVDEQGRPEFVAYASAGLPHPPPEKIEKAPDSIFGVPLRKHIEPTKADKSAVGAP
jgi:hypothetical protein